METILKILQSGEFGDWKTRVSRFKLPVIAFIWIVHISAMLGVSLGFSDWFITKTPFNLILIAISLFVFYPFTSLKQCTTFIMIAIIAFYSEWLGVRFGLIFGDYSYGENLGWKIDGVPFLISINWAVLVLITATIASRLTSSLILRVFIGAALMVFLDLFMEPIAPVFDFWEFEQGVAPLMNYLGWFSVAAFLHLIIQKSNFIGDFGISLHLYIVQLIFFAWFNVYFFI